MLASVVMTRIKFYGLDSSVAKGTIERLLAQEKYKNVVVSVSFNHDPSFEIPDSDYRVLILWEPSAVMPWQYKKSNREKFDLVIPMSSWRAKQLGYERYSFHPYSAPRKFISPWVQRENRIVMINAAKFSAGINSNYGLRRAASKALFNSNVEYTLYGANWTMSRTMEILKRTVALRNSLKARERIDFKELTSNLFYRYPEFKGHVDDKFSLLGNTEMSLVIENESDWVTEKLFDSICAGAIPVYVGPDLSREFKELEQCLIRVEDNVKDIVNTVKNVSQLTLDMKKEAIVEYLKLTDKKGISFWKPELLWERVALIIRDGLIDYAYRKSG